MKQVLSQLNVERFHVFPSRFLGSRTCHLSRSLVMDLAVLPCVIGTHHIHILMVSWSLYICLLKYLSLNTNSALDLVEEDVGEPKIIRMNYGRSLRA